MKKLISLVLALALVLASCAVAFADASGTITVNNATVGQTYILYKVFDATVAEGRTAGGSGINYTSTWFTSSNDYFLVDDAGNITIASGATKSDGTLSDAAITWLKNNISHFETKAAWTKVADSTTVQWTGLEDGYYYVSSTVGTLVTVTSITPNITVQDKNEGDTIIKEQKGGDTDSFTGDPITADIGDIIDYKITVTVQPHTENAVVYDLLDSALTLVTADASGTAITAPTVSIDSSYYDVRRFNAAAGDYTINYTESPSGTSKSVTVNGNIIIEFKQSWIDTLQTATNVTIEYKAMINSSAAVATDIPNTVDLKYGHNYDMTGHDSTIVRTYEVSLLKVDGKNTADNEDDDSPLAGAKFALYVKNGTTPINVVLVSGTGEATSTVDNVYRLATADDAAASILTEMTVGTTGIIKIDGLQNGQYEFEETKEPDGFNRLTARTAVATVEDANAAQIKAINNKGTELPHTGGIGTTIFYILGGLLVIGAAVILVARRKAQD